MADETYVDPDDANEAGLRVVDDGGCLRLTFLCFNGTPMSANITVPKQSSVAGIKKFFLTLQENEDIYVALMKEHLDAYQIPQKKKPASPSLRNKVRAK